MGDKAETVRCLRTEESLEVEIQEFVLNFLGDEEPWSFFCFILFQSERVFKREGIVMGVEPTASAEPLQAPILLQIQSHLTCWLLEGEEEEEEEGRAWTRGRGWLAAGL